MLGTIIISETPANFAACLNSTYSPNTCCLASFHAHYIIGSTFLSTAAGRGLALQCSSYASIMLSAIIPPKSVPISKHNWSIPKHHAVSQVR